MYRHLKVSFKQVQLGEDTCTSNTICKVRDVWHRVMIRLSDHVKSPIVFAGRQLPSDLDTMCIGEAQGLEDLEQMPTRSISENEAFAAIREYVDGPVVVRW